MFRPVPSRSGPSPWWARHPAWHPACKRPLRPQARESAPFHTRLGRGPGPFIPRGTPESIENKCPASIATSNPVRRRAILTSSRQCPPHPAVPRSARQPAGSWHNRIISPRSIVLLPLVSLFIRLTRNAPPALVAARAAPLQPIGFRWLPYANSFILKTKMGSLVQNWVSRRTHEDAQFCTNPPNRAQLGSVPSPWGYPLAGPAPPSEARPPCTC